MCLSRVSKLNVVVLLLVSLMSTSNAFESGFSTVSWLGDSTETDYVIGTRICSDGSILVAANMIGKPFGVNPVLLNSATLSSRGTLIKLSSDGKTVIKALKVADSLSDLAIDGANRACLAAQNKGLLVIQADLSALAWSAPMSEAMRVATGSDGTVGVLNANTKNGGTIFLYDKDGKELTSYAGLHYSQDLALDATNKLIFTTGFHVTHSGENPVHVAYLRAHNYSGTEVWKNYDWPGTNLDNYHNDGWENNMADTRGYRVNIGEDGLLYCGFECAGGNHIFRRDPKDLKKPVPVVGGDMWHEFSNTKSEHKMFIGRYEPKTGTYLKGQQFCTRFFENGMYKGNSLRIKDGDIQADKSGNVYFAGASASGLPFLGTIGYKPRIDEASYNPYSAATYTGGAYLFIMDSSLTKRVFVTRLSGGSAQSLDIRTTGTSTTPKVVYGGFVNTLAINRLTPDERKELLLDTKNALQKTAMSAVQEGFIAVLDDYTKFFPSWAVNYRGKYIKSTVKFRSKDTVNQTVTFDSRPAIKSACPFDTQTPLSPSQGYTGPVFYGGIEGIRIGNNKAVFNSIGIVDTSNSTITIRGQAADSGMVINTAIYFDKNDFVDSARRGKFFFDRLSMIVFNGDLFGEARYLVREGESFYVSQKRIQTNMPLLFSDDNDDGLWAPYSPQVSMNFDSSKVTFAQKNFSDISAIGIVLSMHTPSKERLWFKMNVFSVALGSTYPTQVTFTQKSAIINHSLVQAVSPNKITLTTPVQGTVSLIDLKGRIAGKVNSFSPVSSFVLPKPVASGTYILQVKSGVVRTCQRISVK